MANMIEARVQVNLPHDAAGQTAQPGQVISVDSDDPTIMAYMTAGLLVPMSPLNFPAALQPPPVTNLVGAAPVEQGTPMSETPVEDAIGQVDSFHDDLESMTKADLLEQFHPAGVTDSNTKAEIIAAIEAQTSAP